MNPLRSVGARLSVALAVLVAGALGLVYLVVVPSLERNLVNAKLAELRRAAVTVNDNLPFGSPAIHDYVQAAAASANARIVVYQAVGRSPTGWFLNVFEDSSPDSSDVTDDAVAQRAANGFGVVSGTFERDGERYAEAAFANRGGFYVVLLSSSLHDSLGNVHFVQRRLLEAGLLALLASVVVGYGAASLFARRIRRLERAAERISGGAFDVPVVDPGRDELGQLARAFERMRGRIAQLDRVRSEFIANASHELRTPLFSLGGFLELLADEDLDEATRRDFLVTMREQVERLTKLATELLDLSRLDAGKIQVEREPVSLDVLAGALVDEFRGVARARDHDLEAAAAPAFGLGDTDRAHQIGSILVENALVHTPPGTRVCVRSSHRGDEAELAVEDDGPGIPPEHLAHVFERFYRSGGAVAHGTGLGLSIARELAELMGGRIEVASTPGRTVFRLVLAHARAASEAELIRAG